MKGPTVYTDESIMAGMPIAATPNSRFSRMAYKGIG